MTTDGNSGGKAAYVEYEEDPNGTTEDWLVSPAIVITSGADATLSFFTKDGDPSSDYGSIYTVRISTTSQTDRTSFTTVTTYNETTLGGSYNQKTINLNTYNNSTIYIAFVLTQDYGDSWFLDDINVTGTTVAIDSDTEVTAASVVIAATTIIAENSTTPATAVNAFAFAIKDAATSDLLPTNVTTMRFVPGSSNTTDWTDAIQGITLKDGNNVAHLPSTVTINDNDIILGFNPAIVIPNGTSLDFTLGFYLTEVPIASGSVVQFQINGSSSGFIAEATGSRFSTPFNAGTVVGNTITIDSSTLNTANSELNGLHIFSASSPRTLFIKGLITSKTTVYVYDIQGKFLTSAVMDNGSTTNQLNVETLSNGVYIVKLTNSSQQKTQKLILK